MNSTLEIVLWSAGSFAAGVVATFVAFMWLCRSYKATLLAELRTNPLRDMAEMAIEGGHTASVTINPKDDGDAYDPLDADDIFDLNDDWPEDEVKGL